MTSSTSRPARPYIDIPDGFDAPGLPTLLDTEAMLERLNGLLPTDASRFISCRITNLRKKTSTTSTICYELIRSHDDEVSRQFVYVRAFANVEYADALRRVSLTRWTNSDDNLNITPLPDLFAIVYWFPNDERLDGLRRIVIPKKLQRLLYNHFPEYPPESWRVSDRSIRLQVVRYKPERRAVLRCRFRAQRTDDSERHERFIYMGLYERERLEGLAVTSGRIRELAASSQRWVPATLIGIDDDNAVVIWDELSGNSLRELLASADRESSIDVCARAVAELHDTDGIGLPPRDNAALQISDVGSYLLSTLPECRDLITALVQRLRQGHVVEIDEHQSVVHGDLHPGQLIIGEDRIGIIDFDRTYIGNPIEDIGNMRAQLWLGPPEGRSYDPAHIFDQFVSTYLRARNVEIESSMVAEWTAFALFRSAIVPLGRFESNWRQRARNILHEAEGLLP